MKRPRSTIRDVASAAGVSISTASNALNGTGRTNAETRERVKRVAQEIGFRPNALARSLLTRRSQTLGILTNDTYGRLTLPIAAGVSETLVDHGVSVLLCATNNEPRLAKLHLETLLDKQVDGVIFTATRIDMAPQVDLGALPVPVVYAFAEGPPGAISFVPDDRQGALLAVAHLAALGRRRIAHVTGPQDWRAVRARAEGWQEVTGGGSPLFGEWTEEWGRAAVDSLFNAADVPPDAVFCGSDEIARGVLDALRDRDVSTPDAVAVVGFDNWEVVARQTRPPLTTIDMALKTLGHRTALAMLALTTGEAVAAGVTRLPCELVVRRSCGATIG